MGGRQGDRNGCDCGLSRARTGSRVAALALALRAVKAAELVDGAAGAAQRNLVMGSHPKERG